MSNSLESHVQARAARRWPLHPLHLSGPCWIDQARSERLLWWDQSRVAIWPRTLSSSGDAADLAFANTILRYVRDVIAEPPNPNPFLASSTASVLGCTGQARARRACVGAAGAGAGLPFRADPRLHVSRLQRQHARDVDLGAGLCRGGAGNARFTAVAGANLRQERDMLRRRGAPSEYGQGYATHRLTDMAHLAKLGPTAEFRELALQIEQRFWAELAGHWSPAVAQIPGPPCARWALRAREQLPAADGFRRRDHHPAAPWKRIFEEYPAAFAREFDLDPAQFLMCYPFAYGSQFASAEYHVRTRWPSCSTASRPASPSAAPPRTATSTRGSLQEARDNRRGGMSKGWN